mgnify:FL=1
MDLIEQFYIGKPYSFKSFNCWDYAVSIRKNNGIETKQFKPRTMANAFEVITAEMQKLDHGMMKVDTPENFDIVIVNKVELGRLSYHCGIFHNGYIAHCDRVSGQVLYQSYNKFIKGYEGAVIWR